MMKIATLIGLFSIAIAPNVLQAQTKVIPNSTKEELDAKKQELGQMPTSKLIGAAITDPDGERCGDINSFIFDSKGTVRFVVAGIGGLAGVGESEVAIPWSSFHCDCKMENKKMVCHPKVKVSSKVLAQAPQLKTKEYLELVDNAWVARNAEYFSSDVGRTGLESGTLTKGNMLCTAMLIDAKVKTKNEEEGGQLDELIIERDSGKIPFVVLGRNGLVGIGETYVALPFSDMRFEYTENGVNLSVNRSKTELDQSLQVTPNEYPELNLQSVKESIRLSKGN